MSATVSLTREAIDQILEDHFRREADGDVEGTLKTLTDDVVHDVVGDPAGAARAGPWPPHQHPRPAPLEFRDGLISRENVWIDAGAAISQLTPGAGAETTDG